MSDGSAAALSHFGLGTAGFGRRLDGRRAEEIIHTAVEEGITHIDTAPMYGLGQAESMVGRYLRRHRDRVTVATKVGILPPPSSAARVLPGRFLRGPLGARQDYSPAAVRASFQRSLAELATDHVDLLLLHEVAPEQVSEDLLDFLFGCVAEGTARAVGTATWREATVAISAARAPFPAVAQVPWLPPGGEPTAGTNPQTIVHSVVRTVLEGVLEPARARRGDLLRWSEQLGVDCSRSEVMAPLALALARDQAPSVTTLFASRSPARVRANVRGARGYSADSELIDGFAQLVCAELSRR